MTSLLYFYRHDWGSQLLMPPESTPKPCGSLLETAACLINPKLAWNCKVVGYLQRKKIYCLFRGIIISIPVSCVSLLRFCICLLSVPTPFRLLVDQNVLISDKSTFYWKYTFLLAQLWWYISLVLSLNWWT